MSIRNHRVKSAKGVGLRNKNNRKKKKNTKTKNTSSSSTRNQFEMTRTKHHRRPRSIGGSTRASNISYITRKIHNNWHIIAGNLNAEQTCNVINTYVKQKGKTVICAFINGRPCTLQGSLDSISKDPLQIIEAWKDLFEPGMTFYEKIEFVNNVLLDPAYHFYVRD